MRKNLEDFSFLIPIRVDSIDRLKNILTVKDFLKLHFKTNILVMEVDKTPRLRDELRDIKYYFHKSLDPVFHRTSINNQLLRKCETPFAVIYDSDVIISTKQIINCVEKLRSREYYFALPYDGRFIQIDKYSKELFINTMNMSVFESFESIYDVDTYNSVGGCFICSKPDYSHCGFENENIVGWGHDDKERIKRIEIMGHTIFRALGPLYHLYHERKENSHFFDVGKAVKSYSEYFETCNLNSDSLLKKIKSWNWHEGK